MATLPPPPPFAIHAPIRYALPGSPEFDRAFLAERCRRSLAEFIKHAWHVIEPAKPLVWGWHIEALAEHLQAVTSREITKLLINIGPGHAKSTIVSVMWPAWEWIDHPSEQSIFGSYDIGLALRDSVKCRDIIESPWYRETFRPEWRMKKDQNAKGYYINTRFGNRYTFGMNAGGKTGWRGDKVVLDDPLSANDQYNKAVKENCYHVYNNVLSTRVNDLQTAIFVVIQQRLAEDDLTGHLLEEGGYEHLCLPSEFEAGRRARTSIGWQDPRTTEGELLFPEKFPRAALDYLRLKKLGAEGYAGQHQQRPAPAEGARFRKGDFLYWYRVAGNIARLVGKGGRERLVSLNLCWTFVTVDFAASEDRRADYTVFSTWAVSSEFDLILLSVDREQREEPKVIERAIDLYGQPGYGGKRHTCFVAEDNGLGLPICQAMGARGLPVLRVHIHRTDKFLRTATAAIRLQAGQVFFPDPNGADAQGWYPEWENELLMFPAGAHDDQVDTFSLAAEGVYEAGIGGLGEAQVVEQQATPAHRVMERRASAGGQPHQAQGRQMAELGKAFFNGRRHT